MVVRQILVLFVEVRILVGQPTHETRSSSGFHLFKSNSAPSNPFKFNIFRFDSSNVNKSPLTLRGVFFWTGTKRVYSRERTDEKTPSGASRGHLGNAVQGGSAEDPTEEGPEIIQVGQQNT